MQSYHKTIARIAPLYPEIGALLQQLLEGAETILGSSFTGMYLFGSLASGDFDKESDIDVLIVTDEEISSEQFTALKRAHARIAAIDSHWATQLEVSYIPQRALRRYDPNNAVHPHIDRGAGETLRMMRHDRDWQVQRHVLRERGVVLAGPPAQTLIDPVLPDDLREAMLEVLNGWYEPMLNDPAILQSWGYQSYTVLTLCRILYTLQHGAIVSKPAAAHWARENLYERWIPLIERAWTGRQDPQSKASPEDLSETLDFIRYALECSRECDARPSEAKGSSSYKPHERQRSC